MNSGGGYCSRPRLQPKGNTMQIRKRNFTFDEPARSPITDIGLPPDVSDVSTFGMVQPEFDSYNIMVADLTRQIQVHGSI